MLAERTMNGVESERQVGKHRQPMSLTKAVEEVGASGFCSSVLPFTIPWMTNEAAPVGSFDVLGRGGKDLKTRKSLGT